MTVLYNELEPFPAAWLRNLAEQDHIAPGRVDERSIRALAPSDLAGVTQFHAFAGIGVWSYALRLAGWPDEEPVWTGSCPCQPFSGAGKRKGTADDRHLWPDWFQLIKACRPPVVFGEQVSGPDGRAWLDLVYTDLESAGYSVGAANLCAAGLGAPHLRQRLYFVAYADRERRQGKYPQLRPRQPRHAELEATWGRASYRLADASSTRPQVGPLDPHRHRALREQGPTARTRSAEATELADATGCRRPKGRWPKQEWPRLGTRCEATELGDAASSRRERSRSAGSAELQVEEPREPGRSSAAGRLGDAASGLDSNKSARADAETVERAVARATSRAGSADHAARACWCGVVGCSGCRLGDADSRTSARDTGAVSGEEGPESPEARFGARRIAHSDRLAGATSGFWSDAEWWLGLDGKARAAQPGAFPLASRTAGRVGALRAYGNAIVAPVAATFIQAAVEAYRLTVPRSTR